MKNIKLKEYFYTNDGIAIISLDDLLKKLKNMDDKVFNHHVTSDRNDFSSWILGVFNEISLAKEIESTKDKTKMIKILEKRIKPEKKASKPIPIIKKIENQKEIIKQKIIPISKEEEKPIERKEDHGVFDIPLEKLDEVLKREKEIEIKEEKIRAIEEDIEKKLDDMKKGKIDKFMTKEFIQGIIVGILLSVIISLIYIKFFI